MSRFSLIFIGSFTLLISLFSFLNIIYSYYLNLFLNIDIYFINLDHKSISKVFSLTDKLRKNGFSVLTDTLRRSMKSQLREANRSGAKYAIILGDVELSENNITIKNLKNGEQETIQQNDLINKMQGLTN